LQLSPAVDADVQRAITIHNRHNFALLDIPGAHGNGIGIGAQGGLVVKIFVDSEGVGGVPASIEGLPTEIEVSPRAFADALTGCYRPIPCGVSVGNNAVVSGLCVAGTIGCVVEKNGQKYMLSNNHVLARCNAAAIGEFIDQPGLVDHPTPCVEMPPNGCTPRVASLSEFEPLHFDGTPNTMDAAIAAYFSSTALCTVHSNCGGYAPKTTVIQPSLNLTVKKCGRTTELMSSTISAINVTHSFKFYHPTYGPDSLPVAFVGVFRVRKPWGGAGGDSGALVVTEYNCPVGLHYSVDPAGNGYAAPIQPILDRFGVTICGGAAGGCTEIPQY
jgi:hypothetical protein